MDLGTASNDSIMVNNEVERSGRKRLCPNLIYYPDICLEEMMKATYTSKSQNNRCPGRDSNWAPPGYKSETLLPNPTCPVAWVSQAVSFLKVLHPKCYVLFSFLHSGRILVDAGRGPWQVRYGTAWTARVLFPAGARDFSLLHSVQARSESTQPPIQWGPGALSPGIKRPGLEADHSSPSSEEVKNGGAIPPLPIRLYGVVLNKLSTGTTFIF
jgi:hypothetical protein